MARSMNNEVMEQGQEVTAEVVKKPEAMGQPPEKTGQPTEQMGQQTNPKATVDPNMEKVKYIFPIDPSDNRPLCIGINGYFWRIERGVEVEVPHCVIKTYMDSQKQQMASLGLETKLEKFLNLNEEGEQ